MRIIEQLDTPRKQVFIEAAILEIDVERDSDFGISFQRKLALAFSTRARKRGSFSSR